jgi:hypothetical protein
MSPAIGYGKAARVSVEDTSEYYDPVRGCRHMNRNALENVRMGAICSGRVGGPKFPRLWSVGGGAFICVASCGDRKSGDSKKRKEKMYGLQFQRSSRISPHVLLLPHILMLCMLRSRMSKDTCLCHARHFHSKQLGRIKTHYILTTSPNSMATEQIDSPRFTRELRVSSTRDDKRIRWNCEQLFFILYSRGSIRAPRAGAGCPSIQYSYSERPTGSVRQTLENLSAVQRTKRDFDLVWLAQLAKKRLADSSYSPASRFRSERERDST